MGFVIKFRELLMSLVGFCEMKPFTKSRTNCLILRVCDSLFLAGL